MGTLLPESLTRPTSRVRRSRPRRFGPYELQEEIGRGGMATVVLARDARRSGAAQVVAVKRIHAHLAHDPNHTDLFMDEARVISQINHPNVCHVFDYGVRAGIPYLAMEHLVGAPLSWVHDALRNESPMTFDARHAAIVATVLADACEGLHAAHELRDDNGSSLDVVHRDVSPANIFLTRDGFAKVVDFGTVKSRNQRHDTAVGTMKGKMSYMQPEVLAGESPDRRADIWGLGVVAWELLTGRRLFRRDTEVKTLHALLEEPIVPPSTVHPSLPAAYDDPVMRALSRNPGDRQATARALGRALLDLAVTTHGLVHRADIADWLASLSSSTQQATGTHSRSGARGGGLREVTTRPTATRPTITAGVPGSKPIPPRVLRASAPPTKADHKAPPPTSSPYGAANASHAPTWRMLMTAALITNTLILMWLAADRISQSATPAQTPAHFIRQQRVPADEPSLCAVAMPDQLDEADPTQPPAAAHRAARQAAWPRPREERPAW